MPYLAWFFSAEDVGRLAMLQVVLGLSVSLFSLAMHQAYVREYNEVDDKKRLFLASIIPGVILLLSTVILITILPFSLSKNLFGVDSSTVTILVIVGLLSSFFINFFAHVIRMEERALVFSTTKIAPKAFLLILISFILIFNLNASFEVLVFLNTASLFLSFLIFSIFTRYTWVGCFKASIDIALIRKMLKFSLPLVVGGLAYWALTTMDRFFIRELAGFEELGVYAISVTLASAISVFTSIFSSIWHPVLYKWVKEGVDEKKINNIINVMVLFVTLTWSFIGCVSYLLPIFFPPEYQAVKYLVVACASMPLFYLLSEVTGIGIGVTRNTTYNMVASLLSFAVNAVLNYLLIPMLGAGGAAIASLSAFFIFFIIKTEASVRLWVSFSRFRIYLIYTCYMSATIVTVLSQANLDYFYLIWFSLAVMAFLLYFNKLPDMLYFVKTLGSERD